MREIEIAAARTVRNGYKRRTAFKLAALLPTRAQIGTTAARIQRQNTSGASLQKPQHRLIRLKGGRKEEQSSLMIDFISETHTYTHTKKRARARIRKRKKWKPSRGVAGYGFRRLQHFGSRRAAPIMGALHQRQQLRSERRPPANVNRHRPRLRFTFAQV